MPFSPGSRLADRYVLTDRIGVGGMGEVWRADDEVLGRVVAVKALALPLAADPVLRDTIRREARAAAGLAHPNVTQVFDYGEMSAPDDTPVPYLVMELVQGHNLADRLQAGPLPWPQAVQVGAEIADALAAAHQIGVVHRDIKPGNVMLTSRGAKMLDFGIAALAGRRADADGNLLVGTPAYAAPERLGEGRADPAGDVYSLGALVYECLTGHPPRRIGRWGDAAAAHASPVPPLHVPGLPAEVVAVIDQCLSPDPARRPSSARLAGTLAAATGQPTRADQPTTVMPAHGVAAVPRPTVVEPMPAETHVVPAPEGPGSGRLRLVAVLGTVAAAGLIVLLIAASLASRQAPGTATPSHGGSTPSPTEVQATSAAPAPTDPAGVLAALQSSIDAGVAAGDIDAGAARELRNTLQDFDKRRGRGKSGQVAKNANDMLNKVNQLARGGHISPQRADQLRALLQPLLAAQQDDQ
jgi:eukaryotic-like serine/threonine-protein kinase